MILLDYSSVMMSSIFSRIESFDAELAENVDKENAIPSHGILGQGC